MFCFSANILDTQHRLKRSERPISAIYGFMGGLDPFEITKSIKARVYVFVIVFSSLFSILY